MGDQYETYPLKLHLTCFVHALFKKNLTGGPGWTRTNEARGAGFTVQCNCRYTTDPYGAGSQTRTDNLLITNQLRYRLRHTSLLQDLSLKTF